MQRGSPVLHHLVDKCLRRHSRRVHNSRYDEEHTTAPTRGHLSCSIGRNRYLFRTNSLEGVVSAWMRDGPEQSVTKPDGGKWECDDGCHDTHAKVYTDAIMPVQNSSTYAIPVEACVYSIPNTFQNGSISYLCLTQILG